MLKIPENEIKYSIAIEPECIRVRGNCSAIDPITDKKTADRIIEELEEGNIWAWCSVRVTASWNEWEGHDYLGGCSYDSEEDFKCGGYYNDMKEIAKDELLERMNEDKKKLDALEDK